MYLFLCWVFVGWIFVGWVGLVGVCVLLGGLSAWFDVWLVGGFCLCLGVFKIRNLAQTMYTV